jgi:hypothetical protein
MTREWIATQCVAARRRSQLAAGLGAAAFALALGLSGPAWAQPSAGDAAEAASEPDPASAPATCTSANRLVSGTPVRGRLDASDPKLAVDNSPYEIWCLPVRRGQTVSVSVTSTDFDPLVLLGNIAPATPEICETCTGGAGVAGARPAVARRLAQRDEVLTVRPNTMTGDQSGAFVLTATLGQPTAARPVAIRFGETVNGAISASDWLDWTSGDNGDLFPTDVYSVQLRAGQATEITLTTPGEDGIDPFLTLGRVGANGAFETLQSDDDSGPGLGSRIRFTPDRAGVYQIRARALNQSDSGPYILAVGPVSLPARQTPLALSVGPWVSGAITEQSGQVESEDQVLRAQEYAFVPRPDTSYIISLESDDFDAHLEVGRYEDARASTFVTFASNDDAEAPSGAEPLGAAGLPGAEDPDGPELSNTNSRVRFRPEGTEPVVVRARALDGSTGRYRLRVQAVRVAADPPAGRPIVLGTPAQVTLAEGGPRRNDLLYAPYAIQLAQGQRVEVRLTSRAPEGTLDPFVAIGSGTPGAFDELRSDDDGAGYPNARLIFTAPSAGSYLVMAQSLQPEQTGAMELSVTSAPPLAAPTAITVGQTVSGSFTASSPVNDDGVAVADYTVTLAAGDAISVALKYTGEDEADNRMDPYLEVGTMADGQLQVLKSNDDDPAGETLDSALRFVAPQAGPYVIRARSLSSGGTGPWTLTVNQAEPPPPPPAPTPISVGDSVSGELKQGDATDPQTDQLSDTYVFEARAGERYVISLSSEDFDSFLSVRGQSQAPSDAQTDDDGGGELNSRLEYQVQVTGQQLIKVAPLGDSVALGAYQLRLSRP